MRVNINIEIHNKEELNDVAKALSGIEWGNITEVRTPVSPTQTNTVPVAEQPKRTRAKKEAVPVPPATPTASVKTVKAEPVEEVKSFVPGGGEVEGGHIQEDAQVKKAEPKAEAKVEPKQEPKIDPAPTDENAPVQVEATPDDVVVDENGNPITDYQTQLRPVLMTCIRDAFSGDGMAFRSWLNNTFGVSKAQDVPKERYGELYERAMGKIQEASLL